MWLGKKFIRVITYLLILYGLFDTAYAAKSVFIISKHSTPSQAQAYKIDGDQLTYQAQVDIDTYNPGFGAVGNAVWPEKELMFVTYESSPMVVWASTKTLQKVGEFDTGVSNLAGIVVDKDKEKIYIVRRYSTELYVYLWDDVNDTIFAEDPNDPNYPTRKYYPLENTTYAHGIALDETNELLYVTDDTKTVRYYDTANWQYRGSINIVVGSNERPAVGIAIDPIRGYLYTGHWQYHNYLVRTNISTQSSIEVEVTNGSYGMPVLGINVDDETGLVYCTTYHNDFRVYDSNLILKDTEANNISGPGGVSVGGWYKTPSFTLVKDNNDPNNGCVEPWDPNKQNYLTFDICWDANGSADTNVVIVDYLPDEVLYHSSEPNGYYDDVNHTVTWNIGNIGADDSNCITLTVKVTTDAEPDGTITNTCEIEGDNYIATASKATCVECWAGEILYVDKDANGFNNGTSWDDAYNDLQDAIDATQTCDCYTAIWVAAGTYKPIWDANDMTMNETFELIEGIGLFGHFGGIGTYETSTMQRNFADANNETIIDGKIGEGYSEKVYYPITAVDVEDAIVDGFTIRGGFTGGIKMDSADVGVVNCKIKNNNSYGVYANNYSHPDIHNCTFIDNSSYGLYAYSSCWPEVSNCVFDGNDTSSGGIYMTNYTVIVADDCVFKNHTNYGISGSSGTLTVDNSTFDDNPYGLSLSDVTTTMTDCSVNNPDYYGVYALGCGALTINNCSIKNSGYYGVYCSNSDLTVNHSVIANSEYEGLYMDSGCNLILQNSVVRYNGYEGLELHNNLTTTLTNNWIHNNGTDEYAYYYGGAGIYFYNHTRPPLVRNNTIYDNCTYGIQMSENGGEPNIVNCIVYANDSNDLYRENDDFENVNYCNLQNSHAGTENITGDPGFMNPADPNDLHIAEDSRCKDAGDPNGNYNNETDIDGENRVYYGRVDIGADEYYWNSADFDRDKIVNFLDYAVLASAWQTDNPNISLDDDNDVDIYDLSLFCQDWLWEAPWSSTQWMMSMGSGDGGMGLGLENSELALAGNRDALMLSTATESLKARPERLIARSRKFYDITPETTISARRKALELKPQHRANPKRELKLQSEPEPQSQYEPSYDTQVLIDWLEELWLTDEEVRSTCTEADWLEFIETIRQTPVE